MDPQAGSGVVRTHRAHQEMGQDEAEPHQDAGRDPCRGGPPGRPVRKPPARILARPTPARPALARPTPARPAGTGWSSRTTAWAAVPSPAMRDAGGFTRAGSGLGRCETHHPHRLIELDVIPPSTSCWARSVPGSPLEGLDDAFALEAEPLVATAPDQEDLAPGVAAAIDSRRSAKAGAEAWP